MIDKYKEIEKLLTSASKVLILQADNPDADSIGSALALSEILSDKNIDNYLYCGVDMPMYLKYLESWSLVDNELPKDFDVTIIVDASTSDLLEKMRKDINYSIYQNSKKIIIDHHATTNNNIDNQISVIDSNQSSTSEIVYSIFKSIGWQINTSAGEYIMTGILGDTQGLSNNLASAHTYRVMAELIEAGTNREKLESKRREYNKFTESVYRYKAQLINRTQLLLDDKLAIVTIDQQEINSYSSQYNPSALILPDMLQIENVEIVCVVKIYDDGKITGTIRSNGKYPIAAKIAEKLGGGGHDYASGFKIQNSMNYQTTLNEIIKITNELILE